MELQRNQLINEQEQIAVGEYFCFAMICLGDPDGRAV
jgi:hypothetical protein